MDAYLPAALLHLREGEIVRICGLARAARGQEYARTSKVRQPEHAGGTLRATVREDETPRQVLARFSAAGLDFWECSCSQPPPQPDPLATTPATGAPCEHLAALLSAWVRNPGQFQPLDLSAPDLAVSLPPVTPEHSQMQPDMTPHPLEPHGELVPPADAGSEGPSAPAAPASLPERRFASREADAADDTHEPSAGRAMTPSAPAAAPNAASALSLSPSLQSQLEQLDEQTSRFLQVLALAGGSVTESEASQIFGRLGLGASQELVILLGRLRQRGWLQPIFAGKRGTSRAASAAPDGWRLADDLLAALPRAVPLRPVLDAPDNAEAGQPETLPPESGLRDQQATPRLPARLFLLAAQAVHQQIAPASSLLSRAASSPATADLSPEQTQRWAEQLETTPEQIRFGFYLLRLVGLVPAAPAGSRALRAALAHEQASELLLRAYRLLLARPPAEALRDLMHHWLHAHSARELVELRDAGVHVGALNQRQGRHAPDIAAENQAARQQVVDLLRAVPAGRWWSFSAFVDFLWAFRPDFLRGRQQAFLRPQWWLELPEQAGPLSVDVRAEWRQAEGRYIALLFRRALHWLGLMDLALDEQGRLKAFRITPLGAFLLGALSSSEPGIAVNLAPSTSAEPAVIQALDDGKLLALLAALNESALELLLKWCKPAGAAADGLLFLPTAERAAAALDAGQDLEAWLALLQQQAQGGALGAVVEQFRRWSGMYGRVRLYAAATILEVHDPALMRELELAVDLSAQFIDHLLAPELAVVRVDAVESLAEALRRRGYAPWITTDETPDRS